MPFQSDNTLLGLRKEIVDTTGRVDLVSDTSTYEDRNLNTLINRASKLLDEKFLHIKSEALYRFDIQAGDVKRELENLMDVTRVYISGPEGRKEMEQVSFDQLQLCYTAPVSTITNDLPMMYSFVPIVSAVNQDNESFVGQDKVTNGTFDSTSGWSLTGNFTISEGRLRKNGMAVSTATQALSINIGRTYRVSYHLTNVTDGNVTASLGASGTARTANGIYSEDITATGTSFVLTTSATFLGNVDNVEVREVTNTELFTYDKDFAVLGEEQNPGSKLTKSSIVWMPPSDAVYTLTVCGYFRSKTLVSDTDVNFWSVNHKHALIQMTLALLETSYRNTQGFQDALRALEILLEGASNEQVKASIPTNFTLSW